MSDFAMLVAAAAENPWWVVFGRLHPLLLHFPIAVIVLGALWALLLRMGGKRDATSAVVVFCIWSGLVGAIAATWAGWTLADHQQEAGTLVDLHRWFSVAVVGVIALTAVFDLMRHAERYPWAMGARLLSLLAAAVLVAISGHFGAEMKWGQGWVLEPVTKAVAEPAPEPEPEPATTAPDAVEADTTVTTDASDAPATAAGEPAPGPEAAPAPDAEPRKVGWAQVEPILTESCAQCHGPDRQKAGLQVVPFAALFPTDEALWVVDPGHADMSELIKRVVLPADSDDLMPPDGPPLSAEDQALLKDWVNGGAPGPDGTPAGGPADDASTAQSAAPASGPASPDTGKRANPADHTPGATDEAGAQAAVTALRGRGVSVQALHQGSTWLEVRLARVKPPVTDADVGQLVPLAPTLWGLNASGTPLTDTAASTLARLVALRTLRLDHTGITNATVVALSPLGHLEVLNLFGTAVDDQSLAAIEGMASLRAVYLGRTNITLDGLAGLREARPDLAVHGDAALAAPAPEATEDG